MTGPAEPPARDPMQTRRAAADRFATAALAAGSHPVADALHQIAEDLNAPGDHAFWGLVGTALAPDVACDREAADLAMDIAIRSPQPDPADPEPGA